MTPLTLPASNSFRDGIQFAWDNSSLSLLRSCPRKYYYRMVLGIKPKGENVHLKFGLLYHQALEYHDKLIAQGEKLASTRARLVARWIMANSWGWVSDHKLKNRSNLIRAVLAYCDHYRQDATKTLILANGKPAVELSFRYQTDYKTPWGDQYLLCGHLDRIATLETGLYIMDRKTTSKAFAFNYIDTYKPNGQMMQYTSGGKVTFHPDIQGVMIDAVYISTNLDDFGRFMASYTRDQLDEWYDNTHYYISMAERYAQQQKYPQNFDSCHTYSGCPYRPICGRDPSVRERFIRADFEVEVWDPLRTREE